MIENQSSAPLITRVGVVNWDSGLPSSTFFGGYACRSLGPQEFRDRTPYYATELSPDTIEMPPRTQADFDRELEYAIEAGIDYFAYCWYDRSPSLGHVMEGDAATADGHLQELIQSRMFHLQSPLQDKIGYCAILVCSHPYSDRELRELIEIMARPAYEKVDGRPIVYLFPGKWEEVLGRLKQFSKEAGAPEPYSVVIARWEVPPESLAMVDALSDYSGSLTGSTWEQLVKDMDAGNDYRVAMGKPVIPHFATGWNPMPRIKHPVPWCAYPMLDYAPPATTEQLIAGAASVKEWIRKHAEVCPTGNIMVFAWNEFEEGGWICPTLSPDGTPDTSRVKAFAKMTDLWKS